MREASEAFLRDVQLLPGSLDEAIARRIVGTTALFQGDYVGARRHLEQALTAYNSERDRDLVSRFGYDVGVQIQAMLAIVLWALGQFEESEGVSRSGLSLSAQTRHNPSMAFAHFYAGILSAIRRNPVHAAAHAQALFGLAREHGMPLWLAHATFFLGWVNWWAGIRDGEAGMREGLRLLRDKNIRHFEPLFGTLIAEIEANAGDTQAGLATIDAQLATVGKTGEEWFLGEIHRIRGEILLKSETANTGPAKEAFLAAIAIAQQQKAKSFELQAALSLAKLYQSTGHLGDAHAVLATALEGFSPTPQFPEIADAQTLLAALA
jgi:predicted ATPase